MLQARSKTGRLVTLATLTKQEIEKERNNDFFCPECKEQVIVKAGDKIIPHFAHQAKSSCPSRETGEGPYHEKGKLLLYNWLRGQKLHVKLERYIKEIQQRPDILLKVNGKLIAIEYQCARVPIEQIRLRNEGYQRAGITPIWILGANRFTRRTKDELVIDDYTAQFIHRFSETTPPLLFYLCPDTSQFVIFQHIYFSTNHRAIGKIVFKKLNELFFPHIFSEKRFTKHELYTKWKDKKQRFRLKQRTRLYGRELKWHQWLYKKRTHLQYLPSIVYLPVPMQWQMKSPLWEWQSRLIIDLIHPLSLKQTFSLSACEHLLKGHCKHNHTLPLSYYSENPIKQYLHLLQQLKVIKQRSPSIYQKINPITFNKNIEAALTSDNDLMDQLIFNSSSKKRA